jgi:hypothetical protein
MFARIKQLLSITLLIGVTFACNSNTGVDETKPPKPEIPEMSTGKPDVSYFESTQSAQSLQSTDGFMMAHLQAQAAAAMFEGMRGLTGGFLEMASQSDPEFNGSEWEWSYSSSYMNTTMDIRLTASVDETADEVNWAMYLTASGTDGLNIDNFKFMEGTTSVDATSGSWQINMFEMNSSSSNPALLADWMIEDTGKSSSYKFYDSSTGDLTYEITYENTGSEHTLVYKSTSEGVQATIYWDADQDVGYVETPADGRICWNSSHATVPCSDVGLEP